jgi:acyl carrier protein
VEAASAPYRWSGMSLNPTIDVDDVKTVVVETLGIEDRAATIDATTPLLGSLPELDSMAVLELVMALEGRFEIEIEGEDVTAEVFETLASIAAFVDAKLR